MDIQVGSTWVKDRSEFPEDRVSYSILKELNNSPAAALHKKRFPEDPTPAMQFGKAVDAELFHPGSNNVMAHGTDASDRTKEFKKARDEYLAEVPDGVYLSQDIYSEVMACVEAVKTTPYWHQWFTDEKTRFSLPGVLVETHIEKNNGETEYVEQAVAGIIDAVPYVNGTPQTLFDLKVVADPTPHAFRNQVDRMRWDLQAAIYRRMFRQIEGVELPFRWFVVKSKAPWTCQVYVMDEDWLEAAENEYESLVWDWFDWKDTEILGEAMCVSLEEQRLLQPPWRSQPKER